MNKISIKYDRLTWLPEALVQDAIYRNWELSLSYFIKLKGYYANNTFYNFTYRNLSEKTGIPTSVLYRHLKRLKEKGLVRVNNNNLTLVGANSLSKQWNSYLIPVKSDNDKSNIKLNIQFTRILRNLRQQQNVINKKCEIKKLQEPVFLKADKAKYLLKIRQQLKNENTVKDYFMLSNKKFGSLTNRSKSTGIKIQKKLNDALLIKSLTNTERISDVKFNRRAFYNLCLPSNYRLSSKGYIFKVMPNKVLLPMQ